MASPPAIPPLLIVVYGYKVGHTIGRGATSRTRIELLHEEEGYFHLEEIPGSHPLTQYNILLDNPSMLRFLHTEGGMLVNRIYDLILAMNLELGEVVLSPDSLIPIQYRWLTTGGIMEQASFVLGMGQPAQLDEIHVKNNLDMIDKLERHKQRKRINRQGYSREANLVKALSHYELGLYARGRREIDIQSMFRTFSTVREITHNWEREFAGGDQDKELQKLAHIHIKRAEKWRRLMYPRSKHSDHSQEQQRRYRKLQHIRSEEIISFRAAVNAVLLDRLGKI